MMMSRPAAESSVEEAPPAFATAPESKKKTPQSAVEDLERRLALLGASEEQTAASPPAVAVPLPVASAPPAESSAPAVVKGGKNALLARIMAAKERSQQAQTKTEPPPPADLLMDFDAPSSEKDPPPLYGTNFLQPPPAATHAAPTVAELPPPAFETFQNTMDFPPPPPIDSVAIVPPPPIQSFATYAPMAPPAASAPAFEDLLDSHQQTQNHNPLATVQAVPPPAIDEDILAALDPAERQALLEEQKQIMEQIEREKANNEASSATARAMAFDQRSSSAVARVAASLDRPRSTPTSTTVSSSSSRSKNRQGEPTVDLGAGEKVPLHGQERTQQAIKDGTAVVVQCINCQNWMQVTDSASLMFCPVCQVVSPVEKTGAATAGDMEGAAQMAADAQLAEKLQNEEYKMAAGEERPRARRNPQQAQQPAEEGKTWYDWFTGVPAKPPTTPTRSAEIQPRASPSPGLVSAQTGEEIGRSRSYDESEGLISSGGGARVAQQKSMFACVADSVSAAANQMTTYNLTTDQEGNVHGVDSSSLLAMPDVSRQRESS